MADTSTDFSRLPTLHPSRFWWLFPAILVILLIVLVLACLKMREWSEDVVARLGPLRDDPSSADGGIVQDNSRIFSVDIREVTRYYEGV